MADGVAISAGSGTLILTDDTGATGHAQVMKLAISTDGSPTLIPATADGLAVVVRPEASGGATPYSLSSAASTNATSVKGSAGQLYGWSITNKSGSPRYVKVFDKASAPTVGSDTPKLRLMIPSGSGQNIMVPQGVAFSLGIAFCIVNGAADSDTAAVGADDVQVNLFYK